MKAIIKRPAKLKVKLSNGGGVIPVINEIDGNAPFQPINGILNGGVE